MKTGSFASAIVAAAFAVQGGDAFTPLAGASSGRVASNTALNSHFTTIGAKLFNKQALLKALDDLGMKDVRAAPKGQQIEARGYEGNTVMADIVIPQSNDYDVAFRYNGETYELVSDLEFWQQSMPVDAFMEKVQQKYAINSIVDTSAEDGFDVEKVTTSNEGVVTIELSRFNTAGF